MAERMDNNTPRAASRSSGRQAEETTSSPQLQARSTNTNPSVRTPSNLAAPPMLPPSSDSSRNISPARKQSPAAPSHAPQSVRGRIAAMSPSRPASNSSTTTTAPPSSRTTSASTADQNRDRAKVGPIQAQTKPQPKSLDASKPESSQTQPAPPTRVQSPPASESSSRRSSVSSSRQPTSSTTSPSLPPSQRPLEVPEKSLSPSAGQQRPPRGASGLGSRLETVEEGEHSRSPRDREKIAPNPQQITPSHTPVSSTHSTASSSAEPNNKAAKPTQAVQPHPPPEKTPTPQPQGPSRKPSTSSLVPTKTRTNAEGSRHMMVETETVPSVPQNLTGTAIDRSSSARTNTGGSLRTRPSSDTIRPKKEKKRSAKKPPPIVSGPGSSKAEIFEQRVASEIEGESTDSDETFVYESNPADAHSRSRHHSRTPSTASFTAPPERQRSALGGRIATGSEWGSDRPVRPKRSMKFASSSYAGSQEDEWGEGNQGTVRTTHHMRSTPKPEMHYKHVGRIHREGCHGSDSPLDSDSPFSQAQRIRTGTSFGWRSPRGDRASRSNTPTHARTPTKKGFENIPFDPQASGTSDDERAPLLRNIRNPRTRGPHHLRHTDLYASPERGSSWCSRVCTYVAVVSVVVLFLLLGGGFLYTTSKPLYDVSVMEIQNVLASEQEIMLDLLVQAVNPNIATITVNDMDVNVFAKSRFVGDPDHGHDGDDDGKQDDDTAVSGLRPTRRHGNPGRPSLLPAPHNPNAAGGVDDGTDPIPCPPWEPDCDNDIDHDKQTMLLGRIFHFDSALSFEPAPLRRLATNSSGEFRLERPGNRTESGGSERWERVLQHPFELIVRGILKYQLPLSTRVQSKSVGASVAVYPGEDVKGGSMRTIMLSRLESLERGGREIKLGKQKPQKDDLDQVVGIPEDQQERAHPWHIDDIE